MSEAISKIKTIFSTDVKSALSRARLDEREKCNADKIKALEELESRLNGENSIKVKELESEIESMNFRIKNHEKEKKALEAEKQIIKEVSVKQRRIISDMVFVARQKRDNDARIIQEFEALDDDLTIVEKKVIGLSNDKNNG